MANAVISTVAKRVASIIADQVSYEANLVRGVKGELLDLSNKLETIKDVLEDAEKRGAKEKSVKKWLKKLEDTAYEMDDILDEWKYTLLNYEKEMVCFSFISSICLCFEKVADCRTTAKKIQNVKAKLDRIFKEMDDFKFVVSQPTVDPVPKPWRVQSTASIEFDKVYGRDVHRNKNDIVRELIVNGDTQIMSIVGMGGIGKTTLAQLVYNDTLVKGCFQLRIWICVSDPFDVAGIARGIIQKVTEEFIPANTNQLDFVIEKLRHCISGKKFLLVLDDVWTERYEEWKNLEINLKYGAQGSKILVTTRNERVAKMMGTSIGDIYCPEELTNEECWSLLRRISLSGRREEECGEFEDVGKKIARKCNGLPLAATVLGSLLKSKDTLDEWKNVLESEIWQKEEKLDLFQHLLLSYNELSPALKRCFSYCAVYPKDFQINVKNLIEEWMALGYLGYDIGNARLELIGREYFKNLAMRSLFQDFEKSHQSGEEIEWCKMHDIVHDFARFLRKNDERVETAEMSNRTCQVCRPDLVSQVQEYRRLVWGEESPTIVCDCLTNLRVLKFDWKSNDTKLMCTPQGMEKFIHLRCLGLSGTKLSEEDLKITCRLYFLQTLLLKRCSIKEIPTDIGNLVHLRHLDLFGNAELKELPESIWSLVELQTLLLAYCSLKEIPEKIGDLVHLRHLNLSRNAELKKLPESMCNLLELQILNIEYCSILSRLPEGIHRLESLQQLLTEPSPVSYCFPQGLARLRGLRTLGIESFFAGSGGNKLGLLKYLNRLTGSFKLRIHIRSIGDLEKLVEDAREAELRNKVHIHSLDLQFCIVMDETERSSSLWMDVIEALKPHHNLEYLRIEFYKGSRLPHWISSLNLIKEICLRHLTQVSSLPPMGKLPFLEDLKMEELKELKSVGREFLGIDQCSSSSSSSSSSSTSSNVVVVAFPKLKKLEFSSCKKWEEWSDITAEEELSAAFSIMPCLTKLSISRCEGLKKLPHRLLRKVSSSSSELMVYGSGYLKMPCRNNPQLDIL